MTDEIKKIELDITSEKLTELTWEDWECIENGTLKYKEARNIIAKFVKDTSFEDAHSMLGKLKTEQITAILNKFTEAVKQIIAVNPQKNGG